MFLRHNPSQSTSKERFPIENLGFWKRCTSVQGGTLICISLGTTQWLRCSHVRAQPTDEESRNNHRHFSDRCHPSGAGAIDEAGGNLEPCLIHLMQLRPQTGLFDILRRSVSGVTRWQWSGDRHRSNISLVIFNQSHQPAMGF